MLEENKTKTEAKVENKKSDKNVKKVQKVRKMQNLASAEDKFEEELEKSMM